MIGGGGGGDGYGVNDAALASDSAQFVNKREQYGGYYSLFPASLKRPPILLFDASLMIS